MATRSDTESSSGGPGDSSRWLSRRTSGSVSHATSTSDRYASAPFLLQNRFSRAGPRSELVVVETPPGANRPPLRPQRFPQRLQLVPTSTNPTTTAAPTVVAHTTPVADSGPTVSRDLNAALVAQQAPTTSTPHTGEAARNAPPHLSLARDTSLTSDGMGSDASVPDATTAGHSMPYTWTESYLDESPTTTRARWLQQQTFGPVLQSEGGGSSTVYSTPRAPCDAGAVWGGVLARNEAERNGRSSRGSESPEPLADHPTSWNAPHAAARPRRYDIEAAERGGVGLGGGGRGGPHVTDHPSGSAAAKALFREDSDAADGSASEASTLMATVQQPRRAAQVAPVERPRHSPGPQASTAATIPLPAPEQTASAEARNASFVPLTQQMLEQCARPSRASREPSGPSELVSPSNGVNNAVVRGASRGSRPPSSNPSRGDSDALGQSGADNVNSCPNLPSSRGGGPRGRILKPLYED